MTRCTGKTKSGVQCRLHAKRGSTTCHHHRPEFMQDKPDECPVCMRSMSDRHLLSCGHWIHRYCVIGSGRLICPICRTNVSRDFTKYERDECEKRREYLLNYRDPPPPTVRLPPVDQIRLTPSQITPVRLDIHPHSPTPTPPPVTVTSYIIPYLPMYRIVKRKQM